MISWKAWASNRCLVSERWWRHSLPHSRLCQQFQRRITPRSAVQNLCVKHVQCTPSMVRRLPCLSQPGGCCLLSHLLNIACDRWSTVGEHSWSNTFAPLPSRAACHLRRWINNVFSLVVNATAAVEGCNAPLRWLGRALNKMCQFFCQNLLCIAQAVRKWNNIRGSPCSIFQKMGPNIAIFDLLNLLSPEPSETYAAELKVQFFQVWQINLKLVSSYREVQQHAKSTTLWY